jgi:esterase/lipase superfamily enzyme
MEKSGYNANTISYAWDGVGNPKIDFWEDVDNANWEGIAMAKLIIEVKQNNPNQPVNLICHSLGARAVLTALDMLKILDPFNYKNYVDHVILMDPAVDYNVLSQGGEFYEAASYAKDITVYFSNADEILFGAYSLYKTLSGDPFTPAMGYVGIPDKNLMAPNVTPVDCTPGNSQLGIHGEVESHSAFVWDTWYRTSEIYNRTKYALLGVPYVPYYNVFNNGNNHK